ncbi:hypothetical protein HUJ05_003870 [Dendroctonus ponderosae]|nr:hypothetical protein HUJ05_003870 [Dendroctonus ponderosae]KAH1024380.1 hypothetical protein HUJ05_003870 [Dendroctonus ponderosae]
MFFNVLAVGFYGLFGAVLAEIPSYIKVCNKNDPEISKCIINSVEQLRSRLKTGIAELNVPPIEPLLLDEIQLRSGPNQAKINANITNAKVWGPSGFEIIDLKVSIPSIYFEGDYDIDMSVLILKYKGKGPITGNFTNYKFDCIMKGDLVTLNGQQHLQFRKFNLTLYIGHSAIHLGNLFAGQNPTLSSATNEVVRDNADLFVNEIKPVLENSLAQKFTDIANTITKRFTYQELFPDNMNMHSHLNPTDEIVFDGRCLLSWIVSPEQAIYWLLAEYLQEYICKASDPKYEKCVLTSFEKTKPYLMKGIPELSLPPFDPFELPIMTVNRTLNDAVSINAIIRNIKVEGGRNTVIQGLRADPKKHVGEIRLSLPWTTIEMEYDVQGHLLTIPLQSRGFFFGNFTNTQFSIKGGLQTYEKDGNEYFRVKRINSKIVVGDGFIRLTSKNPDMQFGADLIANFFNEDPRRVLDTVNPIFIETSNQLFTVVADQILANLKASDINVITELICVSVPNTLTKLQFSINLIKKTMNCFCWLMTVLVLFQWTNREVSCVRKARKPSFFPTCFRNDPNLNRCLVEATEMIRPYLAKGIPELKVPPFEPFNIPEIKLEQGTSALNFKALLKNFFCTAKIHKMKLAGDYTVTGKILVAPIQGGGKFTAGIDSVDVFVYQKYKTSTRKDGKVHLVPIGTNSTISVQEPKLNLQGLFEGNEELTAATNKAINDNADELVIELKPVLEDLISKILEDLLFKTISNNIPWDDLYPINPKFS